jgi:hypothetical protein
VVAETEAGAAYLDELRNTGRGGSVVRAAPIPAAHPRGRRRGPTGDLIQPAAGQWERIE